MPIKFYDNRFHIYNYKMSYSMEISRFGDLLHTYWGKRIAEPVEGFEDNRSFSPTETETEQYSLCDTLLEYPVHGTTDLREPALSIELDNGCKVIEPRFKRYEIYEGKPKLEGLPAVYTEQDTEADTLEIVIADDFAGIEITLYYTVFNKLNVICRNAKITNTSDTHMYIDKVMSTSIDFFGDDYKYMHLPGAWALEKHVDINDVHKGTQGFESRRGASSHFENPFMAIMDKNASEDFGNVYGFSLVYSGNHKFAIESDMSNIMRVQMGINPFNFKWKLETGESFVTPETVLVYSSAGMGEMSRTYHKLYRTRLCRGKFRDKERPILINNWEATYFNFNEEKIVDIAKNAKKLGIEMLVLDDGWFGKRDDDTTSLGDWFVDKAKLPCGIDGLAKRINEEGLKFGLWFEPEMISEKSKLFEAHPDWRFEVPGRKAHPSRQQYILNLAKEEVCDYLIKAVGDVLENANIEYVKWDMNRNMSDVYFAGVPADKQGETMHRYILGLYRVLETLTSKFPNVLFEGCSGGGGRNDAGMLYYMPQNWTSDDTDAQERIDIQYGASMVYPSITMTAHVSAVPNHQVGRTTPLSFRGAVAMAGNFGYELDLSKMTDEEKEETIRQVKLYKQIRSTVMFGDLYRLCENCDGNYYAWMYLSEDKNTAVVTAAVRRGVPNAPRTRVYLKGLDENAVYEIEGKRFYGSNLMYHGIEISITKDYADFMYVLKKVE